MRVLLADTDPVRLSFLSSLLRDAGLSPVLLDGFASAVQGLTPAFPQRLAVPGEEGSRAERVLREAGEWPG